MKGRQVLVEPLPTGGHAAALMVDGRLWDLLIDPPDADPTPRPEAIYLAIAGRPMKGLGGMMVDLGGGHSGYLRSARGIVPGRPLVVQIAASAERGKAPPATDRVLLKGAAAILTPGAPGRNLARSLRDPVRRAELERVADEAMAGADPNLGLIVRSAADRLDDAATAAEIAALRAAWSQVQARAAAGAAGLLMPAPGAAETARREWMAPGTGMRETATTLADAGIWEDVEALLLPQVPSAPARCSSRRPAPWWPSTSTPAATWLRPRRSRLTSRPRPSCRGNSGSAASAARFPSTSHRSPRQAAAGSRPPWSRRSGPTSSRRRSPAGRRSATSSCSETRPPPAASRHDPRLKAGALLANALMLGDGPETSCVHPPALSIARLCGCNDANT